MDRRKVLAGGAAVAAASCLPPGIVAADRCTISMVDSFSMSEFFKTHPGFVRTGGYDFYDSFHANVEGGYALQIIELPEKVIVTMPDGDYHHLIFKAERRT